jgi:hypothetical protein
MSGKPNRVCVVCGGGFYRKHKQITCSIKCKKERLKEVLRRWRGAHPEYQRLWRGAHPGNVYSYRNRDRRASHGLASLEELEFRKANPEYARMLREDIAMSRQAVHRNIDLAHQLVSKRLGNALAHIPYQQRRVLSYRLVKQFYPHILRSLPPTLLRQQRGKKHGYAAD